MLGEREASCRLDRYYFTSDHGDWVRAVGTLILGPFYDHNGVEVRVAVPGRSVQVKTRRQVYPPPRYAARTYEEVTTDFFAGTSAHLVNVITVVGTVIYKARAYAGWLDNAKNELRKKYVTAAQDARRRSITGYHQCLKRLTDRIEGALRSWDGVEDQEVISVLKARHAGAECKAEWQQKKRRALFRSDPPERSGTRTTTIAGARGGHA
ncbi:unnamed protein product [Hyaloperonospora brassicae]|uniref:Uncharacterized protein n=1 Tax=Hyaloperonospora brassicae TaxID=162125 RepID=A0AAV0UE07_HYABA|nr:unnamed protein product [Hyaloperonospora brassicae]